MPKPTIILATKCIEVCIGDKLQGYAIFFSGGWDAYVNNYRGGLQIVGGNFQTSEDAVKAVNMGCDWRGEAK